jgi:amino acid adenylation domain-containing protein
MSYSGMNAITTKESKTTPMSVSAIYSSAQHPFTVSTLADCLRLHAEWQPQRIAYRFLKDGESEDRTISYGELDLAARGVAALLEKHSVLGDRVLLLYPPGLDFIVALCACFYSGRVAVPAYPPRPNRGVDRLIGIIQDATPTVALTSSAVRTSALHRFVEDKAFQKLAILTTDAASLDVSQAWQPRTVDPGTLAVLQYTSGSTSIPKGVQVTHANLMHNEELIQRAFGQTQHDCVVGWLPVYHDMGLMGNVLQPLYCGAESILMPPTSFLQSPIRWLAAISRYRATTSGGPNFAYDFCCNRITADQKANLDLSSWRVAFSGAEPVRAQSLKRFAAEFLDSGFRSSAFVPCYGLAESTLFVSGGTNVTGPVIQPVQTDALERNQVITAPWEAPDCRLLVGCGEAGAGHEVCIVDPERLTRCEAGTVGEIWVAGPSVANGYWNRGQETAVTFEARLADSGKGPYLRTGDLGFLLDKELFITGRRKDLIILRGRNHYPHDLEETAEKAHPALRACLGAAFSVDAEGEERLVLVHEMNPRAQADPGEAMAAVRQAIAEEHEIQVYAVLLTRSGEIPRTTSGKIQRFLCRKAFLAGNLELFGEWRATFTPSMAEIPEGSKSQLDDLQAWLIHQFARRLRILPEMIEADHSPARYGLDSLAAVEIAHELEKKVGIALPFADLISGLSIAELAAALQWRKELADFHATSMTTPRPHHAEKFPLSHGQSALFFLDQLDRQNSAYHIHQALRITSPVDQKALARAFRLLVRRHPALRTVFKMENAQPMQEVLPATDGPILQVRPCSDTPNELLREMVREARTPFNLEAAPPVRCILFRKSQSENYLLFAVHHIVSDFWSLSLLIQELAALYESEASGSIASLPWPELEYGDYVHWQGDVLAGVEGERHWAYWRKELAGELPVLNLPTDFPRPKSQTFRGAAHQFRLGATLRLRLRSLAAKNGATLYSVLLSAWAALLHRYSGQPEVLIGAPTAGRTHAAFRTVAGYFVNPVVIRTDFAGNPTFETLLAQVKGRALGALVHQDFPFPLLVEKLQPQRDPSRSPLFQALFTLQGGIAENSLGLFALGESGAIFETKGLTLESISLGEESSQLDIDLQACETQSELVFVLQYNADLFYPQTVARMAANLQTLLEGLDGSLRVAELPLLSFAERLTLESWNRTETIFPEFSSIHELIEAQVEQTPEAPAIWYEGKFLSYADLNRRANQLAHRLQALGVGPESLVGLCMERSFALVIALLGILKAGAAYVPFDPSYPSDRLNYLVQDADVSVLVVQEAFCARFDSQRLIVTLDDDCSNLHYESTANPETFVSPDNLAYVIYTSGSTGNPKGAMNSHRGVCNLLLWAHAKYQLNANDRVLQNTTFSFDASVWELFWPLMAGASMVLARPGGHRDHTYLRELINEYQITTVQLVPSMLSAFLDEASVESCVSLRLVFAIGELLPTDVVRRFYSRLNAKLYNTYGPTEASVDATSFACSPEDSRHSIPIGTPNANIQTYVLDSEFELCPIGVPGELYIGGVSVGRGYHRRPDLTAERFLPNPFSSRTGDRIYKTGDLVLYLPDKNIEFLGRNDYQVKIRGFRIELGEIEAVLVRHPAVSEAVVLPRQPVAAERSPVNYQVLQEKNPEAASAFSNLLRPKTKQDSAQHSLSAVRLAAYLVCANPRPAIHELRAFLRDNLPEYMVPADFVFLNVLPLFPNGKLNRQALPEPDVTVRLSEVEYVAPNTPAEGLLAEIWSEVLSIPEIGVDDNFFELGGDSIRSLKVRARAQQRGLEFTVQDMMRFQTIRELAQHAEAASQPEQHLTLEPFALLAESDRKRMPADAEDAYPLSKVQTGLLYHVLYDPNSAIYHEIFVYQVRSALNFDLFRQAVQESVDRHPILRTSFHLGEFSESLQIVHQHGAPHLERFDWRHLSAAEQHKLIQEWMESEKHCTLHLQGTSLLRLFVHQLEDDVFQIVSSYNNILLDGWSEVSLVTELLNRYSALQKNSLSAPPPRPSIQYRDFIALERAAMQSQEAGAYWQKTLDECVVRTVAPSASQLNTNGDEIRMLDVNLPSELLRRLDSLAVAASVSPKHVFMAGHIKVLSLILEQQDLVLGFQTNGRLERLDGEQVLGMHNMILPLRVNLSRGTWMDLVRQALEVERDLLPHRRYPLVELQRTLGLRELFDTVFNYTHFHVAQSLTALSGIEMLGAWGMPRSHYTLRAEFSRNPFTGEMHFDLNFNGALIPIEQVQHIAECYTRVFQKMVEDPNVSHHVENLFSGSRPAAILLPVGHAAEPIAAEPSLVEQEQETQSAVDSRTAAPAHLKYAALTPMEELLGSMWSQVLRKEWIQPDDSFFSCGGDSLLATQLMLYVRARLKVDLPIRLLIEGNPTLRTFAERVEQALRSGANLSRPPIEPAPRIQAPPLSFAQRRLWFIEYLEPAVYHMPAAIKVTGPIDHRALERSLNEIVRRHESLRTTFHLADGEPVQRIAESLAIEVPKVDLFSVAAQKGDAELKQFIQDEMRQPFNLETGPLMRISLIRTGDQEHVLLAVLHHIIADGWSAGIFIREMVPLYEAFVSGQPSPLPEQELQYADFAVWQHGWLQGPLLDRQISYWVNQLKGPLPVLDLSGDFPRPQSPRGHGGVAGISVPPELVQKLRLLGNREGCTMFMTMLSAFYVLLHAKVGQEDLIVGTDLANRSSVETETMIGFFVNQVALRLDLSGDPPFTRLLGRVRTVAMEAYLHQDVPFDRVVEAVNPPRERNRTPLFQVKFVLQNAPRPKLEMGNLHLTELELDTGAAKFDLLVNVLQQDADLRMLWEYSSEIFRESTMQRMADCYLALLESIVANPELKLHEAAAIVLQIDQSIRQKDEQKRSHTLRKKLIQKSRKNLV